jgi:hypothetical protein
MAPVTYTPEEKQRVADWNRLTKFPEYWAKKFEIQAAEAELDARATEALHALMDRDAWFVKNTPYPFQVVRHSFIPGLAELACRYLGDLARSGNQSAISSLASLAVELTELLTNLEQSKTLGTGRNEKLIKELTRKKLPPIPDAIKTNLECVQDLARTLPYWPVLYSRNAAANNHLPLLADKIHLGKSCPINSAETAKFSLQTPTNALLWDCVKHFDKVHNRLRFEFDWAGFDIRSEHRRPAPTFDEAIKVLHLTHSPVEIEIYRKSIAPPPLTKNRAIAEQWADNAILPFIKLRRPGVIPLGKSGRPCLGDFRKQVIQQLYQLAPAG